MSIRQKLASITVVSLLLMVTTVYCMRFMPNRGIILFLPIGFIGLCGLIAWLAFFAAISPKQSRETVNHLNIFDLIWWLLAGLF